jgi:hypothetical protein
MSEPKRYMSDVCNLGPKGYSCLLIQHKEGEFVRYEDYARLKAEVERLTKAIDLTIIDLDERHERQDLRAWEFAELLRKAKGVQS